MSGPVVSTAEISRLYTQGHWHEIVRRFESKNLSEIRQPELLLLIGKSLQHLDRIDEAAVIYDLVTQANAPGPGSLGYLSAQRARSTALLNLAALWLTQARSALSRFSAQQMPHASVNALESAASDLEARLRRSKSQLLGQKTAEISPVDPAVTVEYRQGRPGKDGR